MLPNLTTYKRYETVESPWNAATTELHPFRKSGELMSEWVTQMATARDFGYEVTPHFRFSQNATSRENWFSELWWTERATELQLLQPTGHISIDHEAYGTFGQITGSDNEYQIFKEAIQPWLNVIRRNSIQVHVIPATSDYFLCRALFECGSGISGTAHIYIHDLSLIFWTDEPAFIRKKIYLESAAWNLCQSLPNATVGVVLYDSVLMTQFYQRREHFTVNGLPIMTDDEIFKADSGQWGTENFETLNVANIATSGTHSHQGLLHCYQTDGVRDRTHRFNQNGPVEVDIVADRIPSLLEDSMDVSYLYSVPNSTPPTPWQLGKGRQAHGTPSVLDFSIQDPFQITAHIKASDWSSIDTVFGVWLDGNATFQSWRLSYDHVAGKITGEVKDTAGSIVSVTLNRTFINDEMHVIGVFIGEGKLKIFVDQTSAEIAFNGQPAQVSMHWTAHVQLDVKEIQFWNRESDLLDRYPFINPNLVSNLRFRWRSWWPVDGNTKPL